jgi:hypothetical protein
MSKNFLQCQDISAIDLEVAGECVAHQVSGLPSG